MEPIVPEVMEQSFVLAAGVLKRVRKDRGQAHFLVFVSLPGKVEHRGGEPGRLHGHRTKWVAENLSHEVRLCCQARFVPAQKSLDQLCNNLHPERPPGYGLDQAGKDPMRGSRLSQLLAVEPSVGIAHQRAGEGIPVGGLAQVAGMAHTGREEKNELPPPRREAQESAKPTQSTSTPPRPPYPDLRLLRPERVRRGEEILSRVNERKADVEIGRNNGMFGGSKPVASRTAKKYEIEEIEKYQDESGVSQEKLIDDLNMAKLIDKLNTRHPDDPRPSEAIRSGLLPLTRAVLQRLLKAGNLRAEIEKILKDQL